MRFWRLFHTPPRVLLRTFHCNHSYLMISVMNFLRESDHLKHIVMFFEGKFASGFSSVGREAPDVKADERILSGMIFYLWRNNSVFVRM